MTIFIGTTGDYPPLTEKDPKSGMFKGFAIEVAHAIFGDDCQFVQTSWPSFEADLLAGKFDIMMGGVTLTPLRKQHFLTSLPIFDEGKLPIVHQANQGRFIDIDHINQTDVKVAFNPGGTNEKFAKQHFAKAKLIQFDVIEDIFLSLVNQEVDVFVTDGVETKYRAHRHPELISETIASPFTDDQMGFLIRPGYEALRDQVNAWLSTSALPGIKQKYFL